MATSIVARWPIWAGDGFSEIIFAGGLTGKW
jgi:hypothetical protein